MLYWLVKITMAEQDDLLNNVKEFIKKARESENDSFNVAVTLYFKAIAVLIDLFVLKKEGFIPSNHTERFRLLEKKYSLLYTILDKDFPIYQNSYRISIKKEFVEVLKNDFKKVVEFTGIKVD